MGVKRNGEDVVGVRVASATARWCGQRVMGRTASNSEKLKSRSVAEGRTVEYVENGARKVAKVNCKQVPLMLHLGLTLHKSQGMTLANAFIDLGCLRRA